MPAKAWTWSPTASNSGQQPPSNQQCIPSARQIGIWRLLRIHYTSPTEGDQAASHRLRRCSPGQGLSKVHAACRGTPQVYLRADQQIRGADEVKASMARTQADADGRRAGPGRPAAGATWPRAARDGWARRMTPSPASPTAWAHGVRHGSRGPARHQHDRRSTAITQLSGPRQAGTRRCHGPSVAVRETANGAHRPFKGTDAVRYTSVDTVTQRPAALQGDT